MPKMENVEQHTLNTIGAASVSSFLYFIEDMFEQEEKASALRKHRLSNIVTSAQLRSAHS